MVFKLTGTGYTDMAYELYALGVAMEVNNGDTVELILEE